MKLTNSENSLIILLGSWFQLTDWVKEVPSKLFFGSLKIIEPFFYFLGPFLYFLACLVACAMVTSDIKWEKMLGVVMCTALILFSLPMLRYPRKWLAQKQGSQKKLDVIPQGVSPADDD